MKVLAVWPEPCIHLLTRDGIVLGFSMWCGLKGAGTRLVIQHSLCARSFRTLCLLVYFRLKTALILYFLLELRG